MSVATPDTTSETDLFTDLVSQLDSPWVIVILDDQVNTTEYVTRVFMSYFGLSNEVAITRMLEVHSEGRSVLDAGTYDEMKVHHEAMMAYKLRSKIEKAN